MVKSSFISFTIVCIKFNIEIKYLYYFFSNLCNFKFSSVKNKHNYQEMKVIFFHVFLNTLNKYTHAKINIAVVENWWLQLMPRPLFYSRR
jgi:hypothetical protein